MSASMAAATAASNASALQIALSHLQGALTYTESTNVQVNKKLWNEYARNYADKRPTATTGAPAAATAAATATAKAATSSDAASQTPAAPSDPSSSRTPSAWVQQMASAVRSPSSLEFLGDEWSDERSLTQALEEFLFPYIGVNRLSPEVWKEAQAIEKLGGVSYLPSSRLGFPGHDLVVAELGVGGGRVAARVYPHVGHLYAMDIAEEMIRTATESLRAQYARKRLETPQATVASPLFGEESAGAPPKPPAPSPSSSSSSDDVGPLPPNLTFHLLSSAPSLPPKLSGRCDFVYCFDVMPHLDLHTIAQYFNTIKTILKPNPPPGSELYGPPKPRVFLHVANLLAPLGWDRFRRQTKATAGGFYFQSPDLIRKLAKEHGYRIIQESRWDMPEPSVKGEEDPWREAREARKSNIYYQRDFLFVMERLPETEVQECVEKEAPDNVNRSAVEPSS